MTGSVRKEGGEVERMRSADGSSKKKKKKNERPRRSDVILLR